MAYNVYMELGEILGPLVGANLRVAETEGKEFQKGKGTWRRLVAAANFA